MNYTALRELIVDKHPLGDLNELKALYYLTDRLYRAEKLEDVYEAALDAITTTLGCLRASILLFDSSGVMRFVAWRGLSDHYRNSLEGHTPWKPGEKDPQPIFVKDIEETAEADWIKAAIKREGICGLAFIPLVANGEVIGKFMTYFELPHTFVQREIDLAVHIARQVGFSVERAKADQARQKIEEELRESEERFRIMSEHAPVMIWMSHPDGSCQRLNRMLREFWNVEEEAVANFNWQDTMHPEDAPEIVRCITEALQQRKSVTIKGRYTNAEGQYRTLLTEARPRFSLNGEFFGMVGVNIDITDREEAVKALRDSEERLRLATEGAGIFAWESDLKTQTIWWSENAARLIGCTDTELAKGMGQSLFFVEPEERPRLEREFETLFRRRATSFMTEFRSLGRAKNERFWQAQGKILYDESGNAIRIIGITQDITAQKQAQEKLTRALASLEVALDGAEAAPWEYNAITRSVEWSPRGYQQLGLAKKVQPSLDTFLAHVHPEDQPSLERIRAEERTAAPGTKFSLQLRLISEDEITRWIDRRSIVGGDEPGGRRILGVDIDITERKRAERRLELEHAVTRIVSAATDLEATRPLILEVLCNHMEAACAEWWEPENNRLRCAAFIQREHGMEPFAQITQALHLTRGFGLPGRIWAAAEPMWLHDILADPNFPRSEVATEVGLHSAIGFPLLKGDECIGVIALFSRKQLSHDADKLKLLGALGYKIGSFLQRLRAEEEVRQSEERLASALKAGKLGVFDCDLQSNKVRWDDTIRNLWGVPQDEAVSSAVFEAGVHPEDRSAVQAAVDKAFDPNGTRRYEAEYRVINRIDQTLRWVRAEGNVIFMNDRPIRFVGMVQDITDRKHAEEHIKLLMREVNHRSKNVLAVVQAIASQTAAQTAPKTFMQRFSDRLQALAASHDLLVHNAWQGVDLSDLIRSQLAHFGDLIGRRIILDGPSFRISAAAAQSLGMALHELTTNASKYGSLSANEGKVTITWQQDHGTAPQLFKMIWCEEGGPPVKAPTSKGFGTRVIKNAAERAVQGNVSLSYLPTGFTWTLTAPADKILEPLKQ
jgi:PAS domain S-box-containing protein